MNSLLASLNPAQKDAVESIDGPLLVLAGAGSGKTRTLTARLAYLIDMVGVPPHQTLTLTFTNKASLEMRERALAAIRQGLSNPPLLCTFHRFGLMFLKFYISFLGRKNNFILLDAEDRKKILKKLSPELPVGYVDYMISHLKNTIIMPHEFLHQAKHQQEMMLAKIYRDYQAQLLEQNLMDFDDLLLLPFLILKEHEDFAFEFSQKYQYIMVDEYQDTNFLQFELLQKLCLAHQNICVVGDDDQSIYSWRGADIRNILDFQEHFKDAKIIKLEENYRSTQEILMAANKLISHNTQRLGKVLRSNKGEGEKIMLLHSVDEREEALVIAKKIKELNALGIMFDQIAILFRINALSRGLEEGLSKEGIAYRLLGTIRFYERAEIKDLLAYLRYLVNVQDDFSLQRIINQPKRGIGKSTQERIFSHAKALKKSVFDAFVDGDLHDILSAKNIKVLEEFFCNLDALREFLQSPSLLLQNLFDSMGLLQAYDQSQENIDRLGNLEEFAGLLRDYFLKHPHDLLQDFLNDIPLHSETDGDERGCVKCMSVHHAKGLEFDFVFIIGMENGFFPLIREESDLQEERRLAYVAFTRAKSRLFLSSVDSRYYHGRRTQLEKSQFLKEAELVHVSKSKEEKIQKGDVVMHKIFGMGRVVDCKQKDGLIINFGGLRRQILADFVQKV